MPTITAPGVAQASWPVMDVDTGSTHDEVEAGIGLCLSGGGYRAMLFHLGTLWRLNQWGYLPKVDRISSVSGGSITAGLLGLKWSRLQFDTYGKGLAFVTEVVEPIRRLAGHTIDASSILFGGIGAGPISDRIVASYRRYLYDSYTLQDLPDRPRFVINATNVQSGVLWRFMKPYMRDYRVGEIKNPTVELAVCVAASSAFPPVLSPLTLDLDGFSFTPGTGQDLQMEPYTSEAVLSDGGVYDNLGLETVWKRYKTVLVSDAGAKNMPEPEPKRDWARHAFRILSLIDNQVRSLRKRQLIDSYQRGLRTGAYWGIGTDMADYGVASHLVCPHDKTRLLAETPTRLKRLDDVTQERIINWGYAVCDAAMRRHVDSGLPMATEFPYPGAGIG